LVIDAKDKFLHRMAATINKTSETDKPSEQRARWEGHTEVDVKTASYYAAKARREGKK
jgi:hypothetical protein